MCVHFCRVPIFAASGGKCSSLLIHELSTAMTNLYITVATKLWLEPKYVCMFICFHANEDASECEKII
jgi:hypothetical protein